MLTKLSKIKKGDDKLVVSGDTFTEIVENIIAFWWLMVKN